MIIINQKLKCGIYTCYATISGYDYSYSNIDYGIAAAHMFRMIYKNGCFLDAKWKPIKIIN